MTLTHLTAALQQEDVTMPFPQPLIHSWSCAGAAGCCTQVFLVDRNNPNNPNAEYRKKFNQLPPLVCPKPDEDREARAAVDRVVRVLQGQLPKPTRVRF